MSLNPLIKFCFFRGFQDTLTRKKSIESDQPQHQRQKQQLKDTFFRQNSDLANGLPPPPPPPRSSVPKGMVKKANYEFGVSGPIRPSKLPLKPQTKTDARSQDNSPVKKSPGPLTLSKLSLTSSNDSLSSNASVNTVKSISPTKEDPLESPPSLPPRLSTSPSKSPVKPPLASPDPTSPKPALPDRAKKPSQSPAAVVAQPAKAAAPLPVPAKKASPGGHGQSPVKDAVAKLNQNNRALPEVPAKIPQMEPVLPAKIIRPYPGSLVKTEVKTVIRTEDNTLPALPAKTPQVAPVSPAKNRSYSISPVKTDIRTDDNNKPKLPQKTLGGRKLPVPPPTPPKIVNGHGRPMPGGPLRINQTTNGHRNSPKMEVYTNSHFDHEEGTSVDDDDDEDTSTDDGSSPPPTSSTKLILGAPIGESNDDDSDEILKKASRSLVFNKAEEVLQRVLTHIDEAQEICNNDHKGNSLVKSKESYVKAKDQLTNESRSFVTASKLFVKSATESEGQLMECLNHCVQMIDRIGQVTIQVAAQSPTPMQTQALISKVRDVADTFLQTVMAAGNAIGRDMNDPAMNVLMKKATNLASVLTTLMRSLRVFN
jgi:uncharacterized lipoprotein NlpE involved in copper resistance